SRPLEKSGAEFNVPPVPNEVDVLARKRFGSKIGARLLLAPLHPEVHRLAPDDNHLPVRTRKRREYLLSIIPREKRIPNAHLAKVWMPLGEVDLNPIWPH